MSMFNECLIHLCNCTWLYMLHLLKHMLIKHKNIFECFNCFWKVFLFWKFSKFSKIVHLYFGDSTSQVKPVVRPQSRAYSEALATLWRVKLPIAKKTLKKFQKVWVFSIFVTQFGNWFKSGSSSREFTQNASRLTRE